MDADGPWKPLTRIGCVAIALGVLYLVRYWNPYPTLLLDVPSMVASFIAGWALLRRHRDTLVVAATCAGVILAGALVSIVLLGPSLLNDLRALHAPGAARTIPVLIQHAFEAVFWPYAACVVLRDLRRKGLPDAYADHTRATVVGSFFIPGWISLVLHLWIKVLAFDLA
jgi:hypothetical protein